MHSFRQTGTILLCNVIRKQNVTCNVFMNTERCKIIDKNVCKMLHTTTWRQEKEIMPKPLRSTKQKSRIDRNLHFLDIKQVKAVGGKGGDGAISFLQLWVNDRAGPDGGDGGHGGHVIFQATPNMKDLSHIKTVLEGEDGEKGYPKDCFGKNGEHNMVDVPMGTIVRSTDGKILADLDLPGMMFIAARGGAGGHGNTFFKSNAQQAPQICEYGGDGETLQYVLEIRSMAHIGFIGLPNAGKSTLLRAITRARPKVASYPFTTLRPHIGMILYDDYEQIAVADLPGLIADSHKNRGLGIQFLKHIERCAVLLFILDGTSDEPWTDLETLMYEIKQFNIKLTERPLLVAVNKMDLPTAAVNLEILKRKINLPIIPISAKMGTNMSTLLKELRVLYDSMKDRMIDLNDDST